jgi:outer membrane biosynthesis protein TonB
VEVITAPPPATAPPEPENGTSALRDVLLEAGVPDLAKGRRPVPPPFARMSATSGSVEVQFSVSAGGTCLVQSTSGPDLLKAAAEQTVTSWQFRRTQAQRIFLTALFKFEGDKATAVVRPQAQPPQP